jgi:hypothetical protein
MSDKKVLTAAKAVVKVKGYDGKMYTIGKMTDISVTENITRGRTQGIGRLNPSELPALSWSGSLSAGQFAIKMDSMMLKSISKRHETVEAFFNDVLFSEGVDVYLLKKTKKVDGTTVTIVEETFQTIEGIELNSETLTIRDGQISSRNASFEYKNPSLYPPEALI